MGQVLHGSATTTAAVRRAIQHSQESLRALAKRYGINPKTVAKWRKRASACRSAEQDRRSRVDRPVRRGGGHHRRLSQAHAAAARRLPLRPAADDPASDALVAASLPAAPWHLPAAGGRRRQAREAQVQGLSDRLLPHRHRRGPHRGGQALSLRRDRPDLASSPSSSCTRRPTRRTAADFLRRLIEAVPYKIHTVLTDNGTHFTDPPANLVPGRDQGADRQRRALPAPTPSNTPAPSTTSIIA